MAIRLRAGPRGRDIEQLIVEFRSIAARLAMSDDEQRTLLGLSDADWGIVAADATEGALLIRATHLRRLSYILPLMQRVAAHQAVPTGPFGAAARGHGATH